jgi:hypothetical protein
VKRGRLTFIWNLFGMDGRKKGFGDDPARVNGVGLDGEEVDGQPTGDAGPELVGEVLGRALVGEGEEPRAGKFLQSLDFEGEELILLVGVGEDVLLPIGGSFLDHELVLQVVVVLASPLVEGFLKVRDKGFVKLIGDVEESVDLDSGGYSTGNGVGASTEERSEPLDFDADNRTVLRPANNADVGLVALNGVVDGESDLDLAGDFDFGLGHGLLPNDELEGGLDGVLAEVHFVQAVVVTLKAKGLENFLRLMDGDGFVRMGDLDLKQSSLAVEDELGKSGHREGVPSSLG